MSEKTITTKEPEVKKSSKVINTIVNVLLVFVIVLTFLCTYTSYVTKKGSGVPSFLGYAPFSIQTDSMEGEDGFYEGDLIISKMVKDTDSLKEKDVITFWTIINGQRALNTHRIVEVRNNETYTEFVTRGDNSPANDPMTVHEKEVVGIYLFHIPKLGTVLDFLQTPAGFGIIVVLPVFAFFAFYVVEFFRALFAYKEGKTREKLAAEGMASKPEGDLVITESQLQEIVAKALAEASKKADAEKSATQDPAPVSEEKTNENSSDSKADAE